MGLLLFPEGERSIDGRPKPSKRSVGLLAARLNVPIYPIAIDGFYDAWPRGEGFRKFATLKVSFGDPIFPVEHDNFQRAEQVITDCLESAIYKMWGKLRECPAVSTRGAASYGSEPEGLD
jgi:1-acyl-sn-glycerol-3-phosphate acyltransferase